MMMSVHRRQRAFAARRRQSKRWVRSAFLCGVGAVLLLLLGWALYVTRLAVEGRAKEQRQPLKALIEAREVPELKASFLSAEERGDVSATHLRRSGRDIAPLEPLGGNSNNGNVQVFMYSGKGCTGNSLGTYEGAVGDVYDVCSSTTYRRQIASVRVQGQGMIEIYSDCGGRNYGASVFELDGCVNIYSHPNFRHFKVKANPLRGRKQIPDSLLRAQTQITGAAKVPYRIVFSAESSEYFGYQLWANLYGFLTSGQKGGTWTRLLTAKEPDDLAAFETQDGNRFPTFTAPRHSYAFRYGPLNKPDVITKWYASSDAPTEDVIVVIDPDSWITRDLSPWVNRVSRGRAVGQAAYYHGSSRAQKLWKTICKKNCDKKVDTVGVPYIVHRDDMATIAPLWKMYSLMIKEAMERDAPGASEFLKTYASTGIEWAAEMFGYNFASTHAGVVHETVFDLQVRDVDGERKESRLKNRASIHMGRAWFPKSYKPGYKWAHTEGKSFRMYGNQVWCKCNYTASQVMPWPVPPGTDFVSKITLEYLHYSHEQFGDIPINHKYRPGGGDKVRTRYHESML